MQLKPFLLDVWLDQYEHNIEFNLGASTGPTWTVNDILALADEETRHRFLNHDLVYGHPAGADSLREAIAQMQGVPLEAVQVVTGASEALLALMWLAAEPGANVILPLPGFTTFSALPESLGLETRFYRVRRENGFRIDPAEIRRLADSRTKLVHEKVTFIAGPDDRRSARRYRETVLKGIHERNIELEQIIGCDQTLEGGRTAARKVLGKRLPSAIMCINDLTAIGLMTALTESGVPVPEEISVIGCEDIYLSRFVNPPLTTVKLDRISLGRNAFSLLESMSRTEQKQVKAMKLTTHLIVRSSTAAKKRR